MKATYVTRNEGAVPRPFPWRYPSTLALRRTQRRGAEIYSCFGGDRQAPRRVGWDHLAESLRGQNLTPSPTPRNSMPLSHPRNNRVAGGSLLIGQMIPRSPSIRSINQSHERPSGHSQRKIHRVGQALIDQQLMAGHASPLFSTKPCRSRLMAYGRN